MKRPLSVICFLFGAVICSYAQDLITTNDGTDITAKILEITPTEVKYKKYDNLNGPTYTMNKSEILIVRFENGENEVFKHFESETSGYKPNTAYEVYPGMTYRQYKSYYSPKYYIPQDGDPYTRFWAGFASFLIPGLGEGFDGEWGRGALVCLGNIGLYAIMLSDSYDQNGMRYYGTVGSIASVARIFYNIWSTVDAVRIAKIKNMYYQDIRMRASVDFNLEPYFAFTPSGINNTFTPTTGLTLKLSF